MPSLVLEIQSDALDNTVPTETLLQKAKVAASKLSAHEITAWLNLELEGYGPDDEVPDYRTVYGSVKAWNPYNGWIPVIFSSAAEEEILSQRCLGSTIAELEHLLDGGSAEGNITMRFPPEIRHQLMTASSTRFEPVLMTGTSSIKRILSRVRHNVLNWALELEAKGVTGDGLSFSPEEKEVAAQMTYNIHGSSHVTIVGGDNQNSPISVGNAHLRLDEIQELLKQIESLTDKLDETTRKLIASTGAELATELEQENPNPNRVRSFLNSIKAIAEGASGNVAAQGIVTMVTKLFAAE